jgi:hypothetical protein
MVSIFKGVWQVISRTRSANVLSFDASCTPSLGLPDQRTHSAGCSPRRRHSPSRYDLGYTVLRRGEEQSAGFNIG